MTNPTIIAVGELLVEFVSHRGAATQLFGAVGADNFGTALINRLQSNGVNITGISRLENKSTGVAFVSYFEDGSRTFIFHLNNTAADAIPQNELALPDGPLIMHVSGSSLGNPQLRSAIERAAAGVIQQGGEISCDPNARPELMSNKEVKVALTGLIEKSSYLFPSDSDLEFLYPECSQEHIETSGRYANAAGALAVTRRGPMEGNSSLQTIEAFIKDNPAIAAA